MADGGSSNNLAVVPEKVRDVGKYVYELADTLRTAMDAAAKEVGLLLDGGWTGASATDFAEGWTDVKDGGGQIMSALTEMAEKLGVTAETYESVDEGNASPLYTSASSLDLP
ncbi:ESX-1 secretion-associated protein [Nocardia sp. NPDC051832]|uniref:ESX-1 secretion-associated protein n=1 Tax=Nocardia sp. NPDC051832 TaxID=3155673 RepID=UPI0034176751